MGIGIGITTTVGDGGLTEGAFTPTDEAGLAVWFDANTNTTTDEDGVNSFVSRDTNAWDAVQPTGAAKPDLAVAYQNGLDAILFDGVDDDLRVAEPADILIDADEISVFLAMKCTDRHATQVGGVYYFEGDHANGGWYSRYQIRPDNAPNDIDYFNMLGGALVTTKKEADYPGGTIIAPHIVHYTANANSTSDDKAYVQDTEAGTASAAKATIFSDGKMRLGDYNGGPYFKGYLFELIVYTEKKSVAVATTIYDYLDDKWSIYA